MASVHHKTGKISILVNEERVLAQAGVIGTFVARNSNKDSSLEQAGLRLVTAAADLARALENQPGSNAPIVGTSGNIEGPGAKEPDSKPENPPDPASANQATKPTVGQGSGHGSGKGRAAGAAASAIFLAVAVALGSYNAANAQFHGPPAIQANIAPINLESGREARSSDSRGYNSGLRDGYGERLPLLHGYIPTGSSQSCHYSRAQAIQDRYTVKAINASYRASQRGERLAFGQYVALAAEAAPKPVALTPNMLWPAGLATQDFDTERQLVEQAAYQRDTDYARQIVEDMEQRLLAKIAKMDSAKYLEARRFLAGLKRST